jgi:DNA polymerase
VLPRNRQHLPDAAAAQRKPFLMPIRKSGHWKMLYLDFETKSRCDLRAKGVYNYAQDASTEVLCMSYAFDGEDVKTWTPNLTFPTDVLTYTGQIYAHNAAFERLIFWYVLGVNFKLEQFYCTATQARANCAPGSLEDVGRFASASMKKDHRGMQLIRLLSVPQANGEFRQDDKLMAEMVAYCEMDVKAMRAVSQALRQLSDEELADYHVNERINDRGVLVDVPLCEAAVQFAAAEKDEIQKIVFEVSDGAIVSVRSPKMKQWVLERVGPQAQALMMTEEGKYSIDKTVRANLLALAEENHEEIPTAVADVIQCADDLWASSVAKFSRLAQLSDEEDSRVRGAFVFAGGAATGRASSYGVQLHNFTRKTAKQPDEVRNAMVRGHSITPRFGKRVTDVLKGMLRPALIAGPGNVLIAYDWSAIEGRVHPWLSASPAGEAKLDVFRALLDPYIVNAMTLFNLPYDQITADMRQLGKVQELALGFLGGVGAFEMFGKVYGVRLSPAEAQRAVDVWRRANPWAMLHGGQLEGAYLRAMRNKNHEVTAARVTYLFDGQHLWYSLPSGRVLCYPNAKFDAEGNVTYSKAAWKPAADAKEWPRARLWKGVAVENVTQATANDILRHSLRHLDDVIAHVHDEIVVEVAAKDAEAVAARMHKIMCTPPAWATGLPLAAEGVTTTRYS